ncbi:MAG TPA: NADH-quinone oxidoreductase subunit M [Actinomycetales bacterium]|nr:NADH-quinone oxidoreductase subunit M [Actinomycetales bacterium]
MNAPFPILTALVVLPLVAALVLWLVKPLHAQARNYGLVVSALVLGLAIFATTQFDIGNAGQVQLAEQLPWIPGIGASYALGVTGLGLAMILLATFLVVVVMIAREPGEGGPDWLWITLVLVLESVMVAVFAARDVFLFYVLFELMLIPVYFLIGVFGGPDRRRAALKFLLYSLAGGLIMLVGVIALYNYGPGGTDAYMIDSLAGNLTASTMTENLLFLSFFIAFAIKAPMVPVHTWLPDTAQQADSGTSTLLVGVLDKLGTFGMITLCLPLFPSASRWAAPVIIALAVISIIYGGLVALAQRDFMRLTAMTSVSHFGFIVLGIFIGSSVAMTGSMLYMIAHGVSTAALFLTLGFLEKRGHSQWIPTYRGMQRVTPVLAGTFLIAGLASIALPGLSGFVPEWLVLTGTFQVNFWVAIVAVFGVIIAALYILLPYQRMFTGPREDGIQGAADLNLREKAAVTPLVIAALLLGFVPAPALDLVRPVAERAVLVVQTDPVTTVAQATEESGK